MTVRLGQSAAVDNDGGGAGDSGVAPGGREEEKGGPVVEDRQDGDVGDHSQGDVGGTRCRRRYQLSTLRVEQPEG